MNLNSILGHTPAHFVLTLLSDEVIALSLASPTLSLTSLSHTHTHTRPPTFSFSPLVSPILTLTLSPVCLYSKDTCMGSTSASISTAASSARVCSGEGVPATPRYRTVCAVLYCTVLYCTVLCCTALHCTALYYTVLYCAVLHCTVLCCTALYSTLLYCVRTNTRIELSAVGQIVIKMK